MVFSISLEEIWDLAERAGAKSLGDFENLTTRWCDILTTIEEQNHKGYNSFKIAFSNIIREVVFELKEASKIFGKYQSFFEEFQKDARLSREDTADLSATISEITLRLNQLVDEQRQLVDKFNAQLENDTAANLNIQSENDTSINLKEKLQAFLKEEVKIFVFETRVVAKLDDLLFALDIGTVDLALDGIVKQIADFLGLVEGQYSMPLRDIKATLNSLHAEIRTTRMVSVMLQFIRALLQKINDFTGRVNEIQINEVTTTE